MPRNVADTPLMTGLRPGESYTTQLMFEVPASARDPKLLLVTSDGLAGSLLIGNENSFLHKKIAFPLM